MFATIRLPAAAAGLALALLAGCLFRGDDAEPVACTEEARASVMVAVVEAGGAPLPGAAVTYRVDGGAPVAAECADYPAGAGGCSRFVAGYEVDGTFLIEAAKRGFRGASATVVVGMDAVGCHVVTRQVSLTLLPA